MSKTALAQAEDPTSFNEWLTDPTDPNQRRFQSLMNRLPPDLYSFISGGPLDVFYVSDDDHIKAEDHLKTQRFMLLCYLLFDVPYDKDQYMLAYRMVMNEVN